MSFDKKAYNKEWMRKNRKTRTRKEILISKGKCPICEILLKSIYHTNCAYLKLSTTTSSLT